MKYTKIRLDFKHGPRNRFYRTILVKGDPDLFKVCVSFATLLGATFEHCFLIRCKDRIQYVMAAFMQEPIRGYRYLRKYFLSDLPDSFSFEYDTGDGWEFQCKKYKKGVENKSNNRLILLEGKGQGIWEDNISSLHALFSGEICPDFDGEDEKKFIFKPWNFQISKYGDFDLPLNIDEINKTLNDDFEVYYQEALFDEKDYIKQNKICLDDFL